jgi:hypothetical protein
MALDRHSADIGRRLRPSDIAVYGSWHDIPCSAENAPVAIFGDTAPLWLIELSLWEGICHCSSAAAARNLVRSCPMGWPGDAQENAKGPGRCGDPGDRGLKYCPSTRYADPV